MEYFAHETAVIDDGCKIGEGTKIWHFSHIMPNAVLGERCNIGQNVVISPEVILGNNVKVQNNVSIYTGVVCEDDVFLGPSMVFTNIINPRSAVIRKDQYAKTVVEKGASIGANATIVCGNKIGKYAFIGAGAVVTKEVKPYALVIGNPAKHVGWMSEFGHRLDFKDGIAVCPESNDKYKLENSLVKKNNGMKEVKNFAMIGVAGYIAVRHLKAIKETDNSLVAAMDLFDSVGVIDQYFPKADFFTEFERFDRHVDKLRREGTKVDFVSICSPNYLHDAHIRFALRNDADAICEKPLVLNPWNIEPLKEVEERNNRKVYTILQLRLHPSIIELKKKIDSNPDKIYDIDLSYITSRGKWYYYSWKGDLQKSGGVVTNIGIHFFDMLIWIFGGVKNNVTHYSDMSKGAGFLELERANVRWFLSIDQNDLPKEIKEKGQPTFRSITVDGEEIEFSGGFTDQHTQSYQKILDGEGFGLNEAINSIETVYKIRNDQPVGIKGDYHPFCENLKF